MKESINKTKPVTNHENLLDHMEKVSGQIQLLALNIAVSAAKVAQRKSLGLEVNDRLSQLVNQATNTVKKMNVLLDVAKSEQKPENLNLDDSRAKVNKTNVSELEQSVASIIKDSQKVVDLLNNIKKEE